MESIKCLICNKENFKIISERVYPDNCHDVVICRECGLVYLNHRKTERENEEYYRNDYQKEFNRYFPGINGAKEWWDYQGNYILNKVKNIIKVPSDILEIGCGGGGILYPFKQLGCNVTGIDISDNWINFAKDNYGVDVCKKDIASLAKEGRKYDFIILSHVLEHVPNPVDMLLETKKLLKKNGIMYLETPDVRGIYLKNGSDNFFCESHLYYFSPVTLAYVINKAGYGIMYKDIGRGAVRFLVSAANEAFAENVIKGEFRRTVFYLKLYKFKKLLRCHERK